MADDEQNQDQENQPNQPDQQSGPVGGPATGDNSGGEAAQGDTQEQGE